MSLVHVIILGSYFFPINECTAVVKLNYNLQFSVFHYIYIYIFLRSVMCIWRRVWLLRSDTRTALLLGGGRPLKPKSKYCSVFTHTSTLHLNLKCIMCRIKMWKYLQIEPKSEYYLEYKTLNNKFNCHRQWVHRII